MEFNSSSLIVVYPTAVNKVLYVSRVDTNYSDIKMTDATTIMRIVSSTTKTQCTLVTRDAIGLAEYVMFGV